jgi:hypothetical protein
MGTSAYLHGAFGAHVIRSEDFILGAMIQLDRNLTEDGPATIDARGWLAGGYVVARPRTQPLIFSASYLAGKSDVTISPLGTYSDTITTDRTLFTLGVSGEIEMDRMTLYPTLDLSRATESQPAYVDGGGGSISAQTTSLTEAAAGVDFLLPLDVANGTLDLTGGISAIYGQTETGGTRSTNQRGRVELGVLHRAENGLRTRASAYLDGLGAPGFQSVGAELMFELEF